MDSLSAYSQLQPVERAFVDSYVSDVEGNARAAGKRVAEWIADNPRSASADERYQARVKDAGWNAERLLARPLVRAAIHERVVELSRAMEVDAYRILKELALIAFSNVDDFIGDDGVGEDWASISREKKAAVQSVKFKRDAYTGERYIEEIKFYNKLEAIDKFMNYMGLKDGEGRESAKPPIDAQPVSNSPEQAERAYAMTLRRG